MILTCADYPLRAHAFCSQIRAKLWIRNGINMWHQYYVYHMMHAHSTSSSDFTFLQWAFATLCPTMLISMLDRYDLVSQLTDISPVYTHDHPYYDEDALKIMIEEFMQLLLNLMNERTIALGDSAETMSRSEIAHRLIFKKLPYSEI